MENELKNAKSLQDVLDIVSKHYDLTKPMGIATKAIVVSGVKKVINMTKAVKK